MDKNKMERKYYCDKCKEVIPYNRLRIVEECVSECWGLPYYQYEAVCPHCGGYVEEVKEV